MTDLLQCPACGFIGDLDDFDYIGLCDEPDGEETPPDELQCNVCYRLCVMAPYDSHAEVLRLNLCRAIGDAASDLRRLGRDGAFEEWAWLRDIAGNKKQAKRRKKKTPSPIAGESET